MMLWVLKEDLFNAQKVNFVKEKKLFIQLLYMKLMLSIQEHKDFKFYFQEKLVKLNRKLENKLIQKFLNGEKKEKQKSFLVYFL
jgi:hypothetical protein